MGNYATAIQEWCLDIWRENWNSTSKLNTCKAFGAAMLSGAIDGAVFMYPIVLTALIMSNKQNKKLK